MSGKRQTGIDMPAGSASGNSDTYHSHRLSDPGLFGNGKEQPEQGSNPALTENLKKSCQKHDFLLVEPCRIRPPAFNFLWKASGPAPGAAGAIPGASSSFSVGAPSASNPASYRKFKKVMPEA
jgi:hypothetical protein